MPVLRVNIIETDHQTGSFFSLHHGSIHLHINEPAVQPDSVNDGIAAVLSDLRQDVLPAKQREHAVRILRMSVFPRRSTKRGKEIRTFLRLGKFVFIVLDRGKFPVMAVLRIHHIDADIVSRERVEAGIDGSGIHRLFVSFSCRIPFLTKISSILFIVLQQPAGFTGSRIFPGPVDREDGYGNSGASCDRICKDLSGK